MSGAVVDNPRMRRYEIAIGDSVAAAYYRDEGETRVFTHTEVPFEHSGQGIGTRLAEGVFADLKRSGRKAVLKCPFLSRFATRHAKYRDLIAG